MSKILGNTYDHYPFNETRCLECFHIDGKHSDTCSKNSWQDLMDIVVKLKQESSRQYMRYQTNRQRLHEQLVMWQGKFTIVKLENNSLRKKLKEQEKLLSEYYNGKPRMGSITEQNEALKRENNLLQSKADQCDHLRIMLEKTKKELAELQFRMDGLDK